MTPIQIKIADMVAMARELLELSTALESVDAEAAREVQSVGLTGSTYDTVKELIDDCHEKAMQHYGLGIIVHADMAKIAPTRPGAQEGGGGGKTDPPWP